LQGSRRHKLDVNRIAELSASVERGGQKLGVPGVPIGLIQDGTVVFARGFVVKEIGGTIKPDADTHSSSRPTRRR
jgi:CubicO group peptidase (beta-lactamase class C family)